MATWIVHTTETWHVAYEVEAPDEETAGETYAETGEVVSRTPVDEFLAYVLRPED